MTDTFEVRRVNFEGADAGGVVSDWFDVIRSDGQVSKVIGFTDGTAFCRHCHAWECEHIRAVKASGWPATVS